MQSKFRVLIKSFIIILFLLNAFQISSQALGNKTTQSKVSSTRQDNDSDEILTPWSVQFAMGTGIYKGTASMDNSKPLESLPAFIYMSYLGASLASSNGGAMLSGLTSSNIMTLFYINSNYGTAAYPLNGTSTAIRMQVEYRIEHLGFTLGLNSSNYSMKINRDLTGIIFLPYMMVGFNSPIVNQFMLFNLLNGNERFYINATTLDLGLTYHFSPEDQLSPYAGIGIGGGNGMPGLYVFKAFFRAGLRYNFSHFYAFGEFEFNTLFIDSPSRTFGMGDESLFLTGVGSYF